MPRKKKTTTIEEVIPSASGDLESQQGELSFEPGIIQPLPEPTPQQIQEEKDLNRFIGSFGVQACKIRIYRVDPGGNMSFLSPCTPESISEEFLQESFGPGKYDVRLFNSENKYVTSKRVTIAATPGMEKTPVIQPMIPPASIPDGSPLVQMQIETLRSELAASREMTLELIRSLANRESSGSTLNEFAAAVATIKETIKPPEPQNPISMIGDIIGVLKQGIELGQSGVSADKSKGSEWMGIIKDVVAAIPAVAATMRGAPAPVQETTVSAVPSNGEHDLVNAVPAGVMAQVKLGVKFLKSRALMQKDPELWIDVIMDNIDQEQYIQLARMASTMSVDQFAEAIGDKELIEPPYRSWFETVLTGVKDALANNQSQPGDGIDGSNAPGNGGANEAGS